MVIPESICSVSIYPFVLQAHPRISPASSMSMFLCSNFRDDYRIGSNPKTDQGSHDLRMNLTQDQKQELMLFMEVLKSKMRSGDSDTNQFTIKGGSTKPGC